MPLMSVPVWQKGMPQSMQRAACCLSLGSSMCWWNSFQLRMRVTALNVARTTIVTESRRHRRENANSMHELQESDAQTRDALDRIVQCLSEDERALLRMRHVEGMLIRSIAVALGATPPAIESALRRIVARLRSGGAS